LRTSMWKFIDPDSTVAWRGKIMAEATHT